MLNYLEHQRKARNIIL